MVKNVAELPTKIKEAFEIAQRLVHLRAGQALSLHHMSFYSVLKDLS